jgi:hypothetical protein
MVDATSGVAGVAGFPATLPDGCISGHRQALRIEDRRRLVKGNKRAGSIRYLTFHQNV